MVHKITVNVKEERLWALEVRSLTWAWNSHWIWLSTQGHQWDAAAVISDLRTRTATSAEGRREEWEEEETNIKKCVLFPFSCMCAVHVCMCVLCMCVPVRRCSLSGLMPRIFLDHLYILTEEDLSPRAQRYLVLLASLLKDPISPSNLHTLLTFCVWIWTLALTAAFYLCPRLKFIQLLCSCVFVFNSFEGKKKLWGQE